MTSLHVGVAGGRLVDFRIVDDEEDLKRVSVSNAAAHRFQQPLRINASGIVLHTLLRTIELYRDHLERPHDTAEGYSRSLVV
jgi:hypothetical protein